MPAPKFSLAPTHQAPRRGSTCVSTIRRPKLAPSLFTPTQLCSATPCPEVRPEYLCACPPGLRCNPTTQPSAWRLCGTSRREEYSFIGLGSGARPGDFVCAAVSLRHQQGATPPDRYGGAGGTERCQNGDRDCDRVRYSARRCSPVSHPQNYLILETSLASSSCIAGAVSLTRCPWPGSTHSNE